MTKREGELRFFKNFIEQEFKPKESYVQDAGISKKERLLK